ncbi:NADH:flavin oxidoreductase/NADH oxidase [Gordonia sp. zg691]|uniref:NADH:flavin oxidoreductase/NADH oxidase n=1 Tax=Gordonia jinghuaiqii TaxID=2758710 RepID=A0A7D7LSK6_9ACTN|nr:NADH:flavin oxidoreductase/NADH oxidase [Gordonia jinghuaiqii]MBD0859693.1 NADH:flavin oxidoreductase/NADH oxidase [Gordonia jinghuaiqii]MCR5976917.1 NADH:flavin oxidoreductase/NADH oxidase [Gordonia jinghuaiqii]QMT00461.1 NADH:flavin oxidoreductase/NADH oxidase [Gordonia jinghuaiqii]
MTSTALFEPIIIRDVEIANRIWLAPMCQYSCFACDGVPTDWHLTHLGARAAGGFGLILTEAAAVVPEGRISPQDAGLWNDEQAVAWRRIVDFVHSQGTVIGTQLAHAGRKASTYSPFDEKSGSVPVDEGGWDTVGPSEVAFEGLRAPTAMTTTQIADVVDAFARAARRADQAGFDVVEIHAAHGYLLHEFLSPLSNHRTDAYGGDFAGRTRLLLEVTDAIRAVWPSSKPLFVRVSGTEWTEGGWDVADNARLAGLLAERGVDLIDVSSGGNVVADIPVGPGYQVDLARAVHRDSGVPTAAVGLITEPDQAEKVAGDDDITAVFFGRVALREPSWPLRAAHELGVDRREAPYPPQYRRGSWH